MEITRLLSHDSNGDLVIPHIPPLFCWFNGLVYNYEEENDLAEGSNFFSEIHDVSVS